MINLEKIGMLCEGATRDGTDCVTVANEYGNGYAIELETALFLYSFIRRLSPNIIVETGTNRGLSSTCMALALQDHLKIYPDTIRKIYTVDEKNHNPTEVWEKFNVKELIEYQVISSFDFNPPDNIDFLWLDADHTKEAVIKEWKQLASHLNPEHAWVGFHDTRLDKREKEAVREIFTECLDPILKYNRADWISFPNMRGMDFIQLRNAE